MSKIITIARLIVDDRLTKNFSLKLYDSFFIVKVGEPFLRAVREKTLTISPILRHQSGIKLNHVDESIRTSIKPISLSLREENGFIYLQLEMDTDLSVNDLVNYCFNLTTTYKRNTRTVDKTTITIFISPVFRISNLFMYGKP